MNEPIKMTYGEVFLAVAALCMAIAMGYAMGHAFGYRAAARYCVELITHERIPAP